jgi:hypothetical protein
MPARRLIAMIRRVNPIHIAGRDEARGQFTGTEMAPYIDIDAVVVGDTKQTLHLTHCPAQALRLRIDELNPGHAGRRGTRHAADGIGMLSLAQSPVESAILGYDRTVDVCRGSNRQRWRRPRRNHRLRVTS